MTSSFPSGPLVVAHRGASREAPENTLASFRLAAELGADAVELDVRRTADGVPVVLHDADVASTTDGRGLVASMPLRDVQRLRIAGGHRIPTLAEALDAIDVALDIEIKNLPGEPDFDGTEDRTLDATLAALDAAGFAHPVLISSFNWLTIERCRAVAPGISTGFLTVAGIEPRAALDYAAGAGHEFILPQAPALVDAGEVMVAEAHARGVRVGAWTVDDQALIERLFGWGVDAVATNDARMAVAVRSAQE